ncbi:helix-turn-helix domain-containing protein [Denitrobacterium detoxificans]
MKKAAPNELHPRIWTRKRKSEFGRCSFVLKRYSLETRARAVELIDRGYGKGSLSTALAIPISIAEKWTHTYRAVGKEAFLGMGSKHRRYDYETKLAAARDFVDLGMTRQEVMSKHGIANLTQLKNWAKAYREGGPEALRPKPKGRPRKDGGDPPEPRSREQELEAENRRLRAEVAYLKKLRALEAAKRAPGRNAR